MPLTDNDKMAIRRMIPFTDLAASIITKIDTPLSSLTSHELQLVRLAMRSSNLADQILVRIFIPSAVEPILNRALQNEAGNQVIGQSIATQIGS